MSFDTPWGRMSLKAAGITLIDCDHRTPPAIDQGYPYIAIPQLKDGHIDLQGVRKISREDFLEWTKKLRPQADDVIIVRRCNSGDSAVIPVGLDCAIGQNLVVLRSDGVTVHPKLLRWLVRSPDWWDQVSKYINVGAVFDSLKCKEIPHFELTIPPLEYQREIAALLGGLDDRITLLRETNTLLEQIAQTIFTSWFVDLDPVRAKQEGRMPEGMDEETAALFPDSFEESELGMVPRGWKVGTLGDLAQLNPQVWTARNHPPTVAYIDLANVKENVIASITNYTFDESPSRARRVLQGGDTIVGTVRPGNKSFAFIWNPPENLTGSTGFAALRPNVIESTEYIYLAATQESSIDQLAHLADGAAYPAVRPDVVTSIQCPIPTTEVMGAFHEVAAPLLIRNSENQSQAQILADLRDTLLPRLISGKLRLPEVNLENVLS